MVDGKGRIPIVSNFELTVEKLVYGGDGLGRIDGRVVFAPFVLPGERIRCTRYCIIQYDFVRYYSQNMVFPRIVTKVTPAATGNRHAGASMPRRAR